MISTSININAVLLARLREGAVRLAIDESTLLSMLLQKSRKLFGTEAICGRAVRYQRGCDSASYRIHHIVLNDTDYEIATSRRYIFKISVSFLFSLSIIQFLDEIIDEWTKNRSESEPSWESYLTNIHYSGFEISHFHDDSAEFWQIPWPKEPKDRQKSRR